MIHKKHRTYQTILETCRTKYIVILIEEYSYYLLRTIRHTEQVPVFSIIGNLDPNLRPSDVTYTTTDNMYYGEVTQ